jgi:nucleotide-binding universal stress UspA family protein
MNINQVIFPVDFSSHSVDVCPYVAALTRRLNAKLTLLHVVESLPPGSSPLDRLHDGDRAELERREERARQALSAFQQQFIPHVASDLCVLVGDPARCIVAYGGESCGRMIIMPTRGYGPFRQMLLGSVTAKVLHDAKCAVLTGPHLESAVKADELFKLQRIVCAVSLDWETDHVLKMSAAIARQLGAELTAFHVVTPVEEGLLPLVEPGGPPFSTHSAKNAVADALSRTGVLAEICVSIGEPSREVACAAQAMNADMIVIGKGGAPELPGRLGSHGYAIVRRAPCPVLCV